jgi:hypothetical protein
MFFFKKSEKLALPTLGTSKEGPLLLPRLPSSPFATKPTRAGKSFDRGQEQ